MSLHIPIGVTRMKPIVFLLFCLVSLGLAGATEPGAPLSGEPISPLPASVSGVNKEKAELGRLLFQDTRLSKDNTVSCASCHRLNQAGIDGTRVSTGVMGAAGDLNSPTVFNSAFNFRQFWDGRAETLEDQVDGPVEHKKELATGWSEILAKLSKDENYRARFDRAYGAGISRENIKHAIAEFERTLITPNARFDRYLRGEVAALSDREKEGYRRFKAYGCVACHQGMNIGGNMFQTMGIMGNYFKDRGRPVLPSDLGRYNVTKNEADKHVFRVPSLRNVALTAPYFHDGSAASLEEAVNIMAKYQLGRKLSKEDIDFIVAFLKTLNGEVPASIGGYPKGEGK